MVVNMYCTGCNLNFFGLCLISCSAEYCTSVPEDTKYHSSGMGGTPWGGVCVTNIVFTPFLVLFRKL